MKLSAAYSQFTKSFQRLKKERDEIAAILAKYDEALASTSSNNGHVRSQAPRKASNKMSLRDAVAKVTQKKALTKLEIIAEVQKIGYRFTSAKPMASVNALLYAKGSGFVRKDGRFRLG